MSEAQPPPPPSHFYELLRRQSEQRASRRVALAKLVAVVPVPDDVLKEVVWLGPGDREQVLRNHPGYALERKTQSLSSMVSIFSKAHVDLICQLDNFDAFSLTPEMHRPVGKARLEAIEIALNKELVAFSAAAAALVAFHRRLRDAVIVPEVETRLAQSFAEDEHKFVTELRNVISHKEFPDVSWQVTYGPDRKSDFVIPVGTLRASADFSRKALDFLDRCGERVSLRALVDSYASRVRSFQRWYQDAIEANLRCPQLS